MANSVLRVTIAVLGVAALVSSFPLSAVRADTTPTPSVADTTPTSSVNEPATTLHFWVESGPDEATVVQHPATRYNPRHYARHYTWRAGRRSVYSDNPVVAAATGVAHRVANLGLLAAYPFYCFPNYHSCAVRRLYRF
jgi:hypothetical protein